MNILVIFTGGTIESKCHNGTISPDTSQNHLLLDLYKSESKRKDIDFDTDKVLNNLSENNRPQHWSVIANRILQADPSSYSGIIVTHGTDTLPYTAAALGFTLTDVSIPIILVSSNQPLEKTGSNGLLNFSNAITFIADEGLPGVYAIYSNPDHRSILHLGTRLTCALPFVHSFRSERDAFVGEFKNGICVFNNDPYAVHRDELRRPRCPINVAPSFSEDVLYLQPYPGLNYDFINLAAPPKAVIHGLYHAGTACTDTDKECFSVISFAKKCAENNIPFYIAPIQGEGDMYKTNRDLLEENVRAIDLHDIAIEAALVKVMLAYGNEQIVTDIPAFIRDTEIAHEFIRINVSNK